MTDQDIKAQLKTIGHSDPSDIPLAETAILLSSYDYPELHVDRYYSHLEKISSMMQEALDNAEAPEDDDAIIPWRLGILNRVLRDGLSYDADEDGYDNLDNISLTRVIDRRKGIPVALAILYIHAARSVGWLIDGLGFPGHFLIRMQYKGYREIIDPFYDGKIMDAASLRALVKTMLGKTAELNHDYYNAMDNRAILLRLRNNRKTHLIGAEDFKIALDTVNTMLWIAPDDVRILFDAGVLSARLGYIQQGIDHLDAYIAKTDNPQSAAEARNLVLSLKESLH